jgi:hypothetical protein
VPGIGQELVDRDRPVFPFRKVRNSCICGGEPPSPWWRNRAGCVADHHQAIPTAEDIGRLPDLSIADTLARLPGVTAQRVRGRSQQISIRGFGLDFSLALLSGCEVISAGNNRGIEFDQFP